MVYKPVQTTEEEFICTNGGVKLNDINDELITTFDGKSAIIVKSVNNDNECKVTIEQKNIENLTLQYVASFTATLALFITGMNWGWPGPTFMKMTSPTFPLHVTEFELTWMASIISLASITGPFLGATLVDIIGRKKVLLLLAFPFLFEWILLYYSDETLIVVYIARIMAGLSIGVALSVVPVYLGEISSPNIRGKLSNLISIQIHLGVLFSYVIGPYVSLKLSSIISAIFPVIYFIIFVFMPETPYFFIMKGDRINAIRSLQKLRGELYNCEMEINRITENILAYENSKIKLRDLYRIPLYRKVMSIILLLFTAQHLAGSSFILAFCPTVLANINAPISTSVSTVLFAFVYLLSTIIVGFLVDRFGRKILLLVSCFGTAVPLFAIGVYFLLRDVYEMDLTSYTLIPTIGLIIFPLAHGIGLGSVPFIMQGELFPSNIKTTASLIATLIGSIYAFSVLTLYHPVRDLFGLHTVFFIFCGSCLIGSLFIIRYVPETKNKTLEQIQDELRQKET
ncbi:facilitated trehalose transporter Tret1-like [Chrysoperla carnea]|uniref:facilitated trehalose transporter Tret1-like n=1 Tax=Chrysoperla carnea TaxID=189513 RepID=UPI001D070913|nr:facilitated trehalose transporter Tret1-like [Chrysoperla carnea]